MFKSFVKSSLTGGCEKVFSYKNVKVTLMQIENLSISLSSNKIIRWRFYIKTSFTFWDKPTCDMWKVCLQTFRNNRIFDIYKIIRKFAYLVRNFQTSGVNNSRISSSKNVKFSG